MDIQHLFPKAQVNCTNAWIFLFCLHHRHAHVQWFCFYQFDFSNKLNASMSPITQRTWISTSVVRHRWCKTFAHNIIC